MLAFYICLALFSFYEPALARPQNNPQNNSQNNKAAVAAKSKKANNQAKKRAPTQTPAQKPVKIQPHPAQHQNIKNIPEKTVDAAPLNEPNTPLQSQPVEQNPNISQQPPQNVPAGSYTQESSLPLPRFVSLKAAANLHVGPGSQYPIEWKYVIPSFPLEVIAEYGLWRQVQDFQGTRGWLHKSLLTGKRYALIVNSVQSLMSMPHAQSKVVAQVSPGVLGRIIQSQGDWCKIQIKWLGKTYKGWVEKKSVWGVYPHETRF